METQYPPIPANDRRGYSEASLANMIGDYMRGEIRSGRSIIKATVPFPQLMFTCVHNECKSEAEGAMFKRRGTLAGVTDYLFWGPDKFHLVLEIKDEGGKLSPSQAHFRDRSSGFGFHYGLARRVSHVRDILVSLGHECKNHNCIEPPMSFERKVAAVNNLYAPR